MKSLFARYWGLTTLAFLLACGGGDDGKTSAAGDAALAEAGTKDTRSDSSTTDLVPQIDTPSLDTSPPDGAMPASDTAPDSALPVDLSVDQAEIPADTAMGDTPLVDAPTPDLANDLTVDTATALYDTVWVAYADNLLGAARVKETMLLTATGFEQIAQYWTGTEWRDWFGMRGTMTQSAPDTFSATLAEIGMLGTGTDISWSAAGTDAFNAVREHAWGTADTLPIRLSVRGNHLTFQRDCDNDQDFTGDFDQSMAWFQEFSDGPQDSAHTDKSGTYPLLQYVGLNFHGQTNSVSSYLQVGQSFPGTPTSVSVDFSGPGGVTYANQTATYHSDREEWGFDSFVFPATPAPGLWWVSGVSITMDNGSKATYTAASPFVEYAGTYTTDTGSTGTIATFKTLVGQDYLPPATGTFYYIDTFANASTTPARMDPGLKVFAEDDVVHWIARNDDRVDLWAGLKIPLVSGRKYFICAEDFYGNGNSYSIRISNAGFGGSSQGTATIPDAAEPDDVPANAKEMQLNQVLDRSFKRADKDWFYFVAP